ncbi:phosphate acetyltransferase [uncultured Marinococcus sp.]|nr:phosphate acetyltransferase [uncultured Marinococcus sp.]
MWEELIEKVRKKRPSILFMEGEDSRVVEAALKLSREKIIHPILVGNEYELWRKVKNVKNTDIEIVDPSTFYSNEKICNYLFQKLLTKYSQDRANQLVRSTNYFSMGLLHYNIGEGLIGGATFKTSEVLRPALEIIKTKKGIQRISSYFLMNNQEKTFLFADCAVNPSPNSYELAEIAFLSAEAAELYNLNPKVAFLSYSTNGSAISSDTEKVSEATKIFINKHDEYPAEGEIQFDAAVTPAIAARKNQNSVIHGEANVLVFPDLNSANIAYKITERLAGYQAIGPIIQGLNRPVNDLSRGCSMEDIYYLGIITGWQAINNKRFSFS